MHTWTNGNHPTGKAAAPLKNERNKNEQSNQNLYCYR